MADYLSRNEFAGTGAVMTVDINFAGNSPDVGSGAVPYFNVADVKAKVLTPGSATTAPTETDMALVYVGPTRFKTASAIAQGNTLVVYRQTQDKYGLVNFVALQNVTESDLDTLSRQTLFLAEESKDSASRASVVAQDANIKASTASGTANAAVAVANAAATTANSASGTANSAAAAASSAVTTANKAATDAASAERHATNVETLAASAQAAASAASTKADTAVGTANTAKTTADGIDAKATSALTQAASAVSTANDAKSTAQGIDAKASNALAQAGNAVTTANNAQSVASGVDAKASKAQSDAASAVTTANNAAAAASAAAPKSGAVLSGATADVDPDISSSSLALATTRWVRLLINFFGLGLGKGGASRTFSNCNTALDTGTFNCEAGTANAPVSTAGVLEVYKGSGNSYFQRFSDQGGSYIWYRRSTDSGDSWGTWQQLLANRNGSVALPPFLEVGDASSTSILDLHGPGGNADYDVRVQAVAMDASTPGSGRLSVFASRGISTTGPVSATQADLSGGVNAYGGYTYLASNVIGIRCTSTDNSGNVHVWFFNNNGSERGLMYMDNSSTFRWRAAGGDDRFQIRANGDVQAARDVYSGGGSAYLYRDGNVYGPTWQGYLSNYLVAFYVQRNQLASDYATFVGSAGGIGSYGMFQITGTTAAPGQQVLGSNLKFSSTNSASTSGPTGTWLCMGNGNNGGISIFLRVA